MIKFIVLIILLLLASKFFLSYDMPILSVLCIVFAGLTFFANLSLIFKIFDFIFGVLSCGR